MSDPESLPTETNLPVVDDAVLVEISGHYGLSQADLWQVVGEANIGNLGAWALGEASRLQDEGVSARDAFLGGVGYTLLALLKQISRERDKEKVAAMWATLMDEPATEAQNNS